MEIGAIHTQKDKEISILKVEEIQSRLNGHVSMWIHMFNIGECWDHTSRIRESLVILSCEVPKMTLLIKEHKEQKLDTLPSMRPMVSACTGTNVPLSEILCEILEPVVREIEESAEVITSENLPVKSINLTRSVKVQTGVAKKNPCSLQQMRQPCTLI